MIEEIDVCRVIYEELLSTLVTGQTLGSMWMDTLPPVMTKV